MSAFEREQILSQTGRQHLLQRVEFPQIAAQLAVVALPDHAQKEPQEDLERPQLTQVSVPLVEGQCAVFVVNHLRDGRRDLFVLAQQSCRQVLLFLRQIRGSFSFCYRILFI